MKKQKVANPGLSWKANIILLTLISIVALVLRIIYPFKVVFGYGFTNFLETDAWNRMLYAQRMADMNFLSSIAYMVKGNLLFSWIVSVLGRVFPIELVGAWLPPLLGVATIIVVYFIAKSLWNSNIGLLAALFTAVIPSEFLHRTLLGFADHHALEILLLSLIILFIIKSIQSPAVFDRYSILAGVCIVLYMFNWQVGLYLSIGLLLLFALGLVILNKIQKGKWYAHLMALAIPVIIALVIYLPIGGWREVAGLIPGSQIQEASTANEIVKQVTEVPNKRTISELMPLFYPFGKFDPGVVVVNLHLFAIIFLFGLWFLRKHLSNKAILVFAIWTLVMMALTLNERRWLYYLTLNVAIISAFAIYEIAKKLKGKQLQNAIILAIPLLFISLFFAKNIGANQPYQMTPEWRKALEWLKDEPAGNVTAWSDYGHWIQYVSGKWPNYLPGPGGNLAAKAFLSRDGAEAMPYLKELQTTYLIVDRVTLEKKYGAMEVYARSGTQKTASFMYQLLNNKYPNYLELVYQSPNIRIYECPVEWVKG